MAIEIPIVYLVTPDAEEYIEYIAVDKADAEEHLAFLKNRKIYIPDNRDQMWKNMGLSYLERERICSLLRDIRADLETSGIKYEIKYDCLHDEEELHVSHWDTLTIRVVKVSPINSNKTFVHTLEVLPQQDGQSNEWTGQLLKLTLNDIAEIGRTDTISTKDFIIKSRPIGYIYSSGDKKNIIRQKENWLFVRQAGVN